VRLSQPRNPARHEVTVAVADTPPAVGLRVPFHINGAPRSGKRIEKLNFLLRAAERIPDCVPALVRF
jgi:hypothetical protein